MDAASSRLRASPRSRSPRYLVEEFEVPDENNGADPQTLPFRTLNLKLLVDTEDRTGYEVLEIARFKKSPAANGAPQLDVNYIPPLLACDAWKPMAEQFCKCCSITSAAGRRLWPTKVVTRGITFETNNPGDNKLLGRLAVLNEATAVLNTMAFAEGIHPFTAYLELCRFVGQLAIFRGDCRAPKLPAL